MTVHVIPYEECPDSRYHADDFGDITDGQPTLSSSCARTLLESPFNAWVLHPSLGNARKETPWMERQASQRRGSIMHGLLLETMDVFAIASDMYSDWRTKDAREFRDQSLEEGLLPILRHELEEAQAQALAISALLSVNGVSLVDGEAELTIVYQAETDHGPIWIRTRLDHFDTPTITDLKVRSGSFSNGALLGAIDRYGYHIQAAAYVEAAEKAWPMLESRIRFLWAFMQLDPAPDVLVVPPDGAIMAAGRAQWNEAKNLWAKCLRDKNWPQYGRRDAVHAEPWFARRHGL